MSEVRKAVDSILSGKKQTVSTNSASAVMGNIIVTMRNQTDALSNKFSKLDVVNRLKDKVKKANDNLEKKLKQTYVKARTYAQILTEQGVVGRCWHGLQLPVSAARSVWLRTAHGHFIVVHGR